MLIWSVIAFQKTKIINTIVITVPEKDTAKVETMLNSHIDNSGIVLVKGGNSRQESVYNGLKELNSKSPDFVLIHDAARPWVLTDLILRVLKGAEKYGACIPVIPIADAVKEVNSEGFLVKNLSRDSVYGAQTPQGFSFNKILAAHRAARDKGSNSLIDDAEVYSQLYSPIFTVEGDKRNKKITYKSDIL